MRITDQYLWNIVFTLFFLALVVMGAVIIDGESTKGIGQLVMMDYVLMTLATWRVIRLVVYDGVFKWFREQFYDAKETRGGVVLEKPVSGPRRTLADLISCPWCFGVWAAAMVTFFYLMFSWAFYPVLFLAVAAVATFMQLLANLIGHKAEQLKRENERY